MSFLHVFNWSLSSASIQEKHMLIAGVCTAQLTLELSQHAPTGSLILA